METVALYNSLLVISLVLIELLVVIISDQELNVVGERM